MDSWYDLQVRKMEVGGNDSLNSFLACYGIAKETDTVAKCNSEGARVYRDRIQVLADGLPWKDPPVVIGGGGGGGDEGSWGSWDDDGGSSHGWRKETEGSFVGGGDGVYTRAQVEASAANKERFFARKMAEDESRPQGIPPSQGGKYVGFGSSPPGGPTRTSHNDGSFDEDVLAVMSQGLGKLSSFAASAAQATASIVEAGTKELAAKVKEGGYDYKVSETVNVVTNTTAEIGHKTWGIFRGVMTLASQKVEELAREGMSWNDDDQETTAERKSHPHGFQQESNGGGHERDIC
ncbi:hypothetical protein MLD38_032646 [Melastoma candidum]|uniref:Uncharacterized protein n=1 Tax=Melastoma candidum TaxID=119954 RepID=A0ACB9M8I9_9MYRT|nr:hypothetical protein MLD38_032646 [Melastoma candidum]